MAVQLNKGDLVTVLNNDVWSHCFDAGSKVEFLSEDSSGTYEFKQAGHTGRWPLTQVLHESEFEVIKQAEKEAQVVTKQASGVGEGIDKEEQSRLLYVVKKVATGQVIHATHDRDFAREVKAEFGGKKAGYVIITHRAVQEIR